MAQRSRAAAGEAKSAPIAATAPAPATAPSASVSSTATLQIGSVPPGADIEVDGSFVGNTPSDLQVAEGDHTLVVKKSGFKDWERKLKSRAGSNVHINAELEKSENSAPTGQNN